MSDIKKLQVVFMLSILCVFNVGAIKLTKEERKDFRKNVCHIGCTVDFSKAKIDGMPLENFLSFYAEKTHKTEGYITTFLETLPEIIRTYPKTLLSRERRASLDYKNLGYTYFVDEPQKYNILVIINSITTKGGYDAEVRFYRDSIDDYYSFEMESDDRKWNDDEVLMQEGMAQLGVMTATKIHSWGRDSFPKELKAKE